MSLATHTPAVSGHIDSSASRYGDEKPASEMLFSYGFLDDDQSEAKQVVLDIAPPDDDPLGVAKNMFCQSTPGIKLSTGDNLGQSTSAPPSSAISWDSPLVWWASVNEEDGLYIGLAQRTDGTKELEATWKGEKIHSPDQLQGFLAADSSWDIFKLRATVLVLDRVENQLLLLRQTEQALETVRENEDLFKTLFRPDVLGLILHLRKLEEALLQRAIDDLIEQVGISLFYVAGT